MDRDFIIGILKKLVLGALVVSGLVMGTIGWFAYNPGYAWRLLIRPAVIGRDVQESWSDAQIRFNRTQGLSWRFEWTVSGYKIERVSPKVQFSGDLKAAGTIRLFSPGLKLDVDQLEFKSPQPGLLALSAKEGASDLNPYEMIQQWRKRLKRFNSIVNLNNVRVQIDDLGLVENDKVGDHISFSVQKPGSSEPQDLDINIGLKNDSTETRVDARVRLDLVEAESGFLKMHIEQKGPQLSAISDMEMAIPGERAILKGKLGAQMGGEGRPKKIESTIEGNVFANQIMVTGAGALENLPGGIPGLKNLKWTMDLPLWKGIVLDHLSGRLTVSAAVPLFFVNAEVRTQLEKSCQCKWPESLNVDLEGKFWPAHLIYSHADERPIAALNFTLEPLTNRLAELKMTGEMRISKSVNGEFQYAPTVDGFLKLPNFQALKTLLESNKIMVPSPFDVLEGSIEAKMKTTLWQSSKGLVIPIEVATNLYTQIQKVKTFGKITLYIPEGFKSMDVVTDINIDDFVIELPPLDPVQGFPQLTKDSRVLTQPPAQAESKGFKVGLIYSFRTTKPGAVRLLSKLAKPAIPLSLDLDRTAKGDVLGTLKIESFELTYLHRTMFIDLLRVIMDDRESADFAVDGRLRMEQTNYKIFMAISGTLQSPLIKLTSEPELPRSDIISVLLYDRTNDQLVAADRETVGTFDSAISDRAIGLLGLWIFASTPIRSFSYNPATKVYTATVQLAEGTTASVGTDWEQAAQLEVRKRVTRRWVLTASWAPSDEKDQAGKLVLQWEKRF